MDSSLEQAAAFDAIDAHLDSALSAIKAKDEAPTPDLTPEDIEELRHKEWRAQFGDLRINPFEPGPERSAVELARHAIARGETPEDFGFEPEPEGDTDEDDEALARHLSQQSSEPDDQGFSRFTEDDADELNEFLAAV